MDPMEDNEYDDGFTLALNVRLGQCIPKWSPSLGWKKKYKKLSLILQIFIKGDQMIGSCYNSTHVAVKEMYIFFCRLSWNC